jgi:hypothetical protein
MPLALAELLDVQPVEDDLAGVVADVEHPPGRGRGPAQRPDRAGIERTLQRLLERGAHVRLLDAALDRQVDHVAGRRRAQRRLQRVGRTQDALAQAGVQLQRQAVQSRLDLAVGIGVAGGAADQPVDRLAHDRRGPAEVHPGSQLQHAAQDPLLHGLVGCHPPDGVDGPAHQAGHAVEVGPQAIRPARTAASRSARPGRSRDGPARRRGRRRP